MNYALIFIYSAFTSLIVSFFVSMIIGNSVGVHYLNKLDKDWRHILNKVLDEMKKAYKGRMNMSLKVEPKQVDITIDNYQRIEKLSQELHKMFVDGGFNVALVEQKEAELHNEIQLLKKVKISVTLT